jgi:hypothetical protein
MNNDSFTFSSTMWITFTRSIIFHSKKW